MAIGDSNPDSSMLKRRLSYHLFTRNSHHDGFELLKLSEQHRNICTPQRYSHALFQFLTLRSTSSWELYYDLSWELKIVGLCIPEKLIPKYTNYGKVFQPRWNFYNSFFFFNPFNYIVSNRQGRIGKPIYKSFEELRSTADSFIIFLKSLEWKENLPGTESCLGGEQTQSNSLDTDQVHGKHYLCHEGLREEDLPRLITFW